MFSAHRCRNGYLAAKYKASIAITREEQLMWLHQAQVWNSRWKRAN